MPTPAPDKTIMVQASLLTSRLILLQGDWPSEPSLRDLSPQMVEALLKRIERKARVNTCLRNIAGVLFIVYEYLRYSGMHFDYGGAMVGGLIIGAFMWGGLIPGMKYPIYALTQTHDIRILPTLIQATENNWGRHPQVMGAICRLLQQITETDAGLLNPELQKRLWNIALPPLRQEGGYDEPLVVSALQTFTHIGSRDILTRMRRVTHESNEYPVSQHVTALIEQLIPVMETRLQRQEVPQTLLRASDASAALPDTLLRAAHTSTPEPTAQLLRASTSEHSETET